MLYPKMGVLVFCAAQVIIITKKLDGEFSSSQSVTNSYIH